MNFCTKLTSEINFEPSSIQPCCDVHKIEVPQFPFRGGYLDMDAYAKHLVMVLNRLQDNNDKLCRPCPQLVKNTNQSSHAINVYFQAVSINMHRHLCNCRCVYCKLWQTHKNDGYPILPVLQSMEEQKVLHPECAFSWGGGEPSILSDFEEASLWIKAHDWWQHIHTSGLRFSPAIAALLHEQRGEINISLDCGSAETYRKVKGVDGFDKVCANLGQYADKAAHPALLILKYIIFDMNNSIAEIEAFLRLCVQLGVNRVQYSLNFIELRGNGPSQKTLLGAAFFAHHAAQLGLLADAFFIPEKWQTRIDALRVEYFER